VNRPQEGLITRRPPVLTIPLHGDVEFRTL